MNPTTADRLRWGIASTGNIAKTFAKGLGASSTGRLVAVASRTRASAEAFGSGFGLDADKCHEGYGALLADPDVQAIYVATPHPQHAQCAILAARAGKHVLCEKPLTVNHADAMAVVEAVKEAGIFAMEAFMYRCHPLAAEAARLLREGAIGKLQLIDAGFSFRTGAGADSRLICDELAGGGILDVGCYAVSFARLVAGIALGRDFAEPLEVTGQAALESTGVDGYATGLLKFEGGILARLHTGVRLNADNTVRLYGDAGRMELAGLWIPAEKGVVKVFRGGQVEEYAVAADRPLYALEADAFAEGVRTGKVPWPAMSLHDTLGNMRTLDRWRRSCGVVYSFEKPGGLPAFGVDGQPVRRAEDAPMIYGRVPGLDKPVARLVMGVDNQPDLPTSAVVFDDYFRRGGNAFDTAHVYGGQRSRQLGVWMKSRGLRDECVVIAKGAHTPLNFPQFVRKQLGQQLEWLDTDYCDLYFLHRDNPDVPAGEFVDVMHELASEGLIRGPFGGSNWSLRRAQEAYEYGRRHGKAGFGVLSNNLSLAEMVDPVWGGCVSAHDDAFVAWMRQTGVANFSWSSQARGFFVPSRDLGEEEIRRCWVSDANLERRRRTFDLASQLGVEPVAVAAAWVLRQPFPTFALIGPRTLEETRTSLPALRVELTDAQVAWLDLKRDSLA